jgi:hypothetical protein
MIAAIEDTTLATVAPSCKIGATEVVAGSTLCSRSYRTVEIRSIVDSVTKVLVLSRTFHWTGSLLSCQWVFY